MSSVLSSVTPVDDAAVATASPKVDPEKAVNGSSDHADGHSPELLVAFSEPSDPDNPKDWAPSRKWVVTSVLSATGFNRIMVSTMMAPALPLLMQQFNMSNAEANMALSVYLLATAVGPMFIGPLSEIYGRSPILHASNAWFLIWNLVCGFASSKALLITSRLLAGLGASAIYALAGGVLGDMYRPEERGRSLGIYLLIPLLGAAIGPVIGGYLTECASWRWMFWATSIAQAVMIVASYFTFRETFAPAILERRAKSLRRSTGLFYYTAAACQHQGKSIAKVIQKSLSRPLRLLIYHPLIQINGALSAFNYGILYIVLATFSTVWIDFYHEAISTSGLHYFAIAFGEIAGSQVGGYLMDWSYRKLKARYQQGDVPEHRVPLVFPFAILAPLGLVLVGWAIYNRLPWPAVDSGVIILMFGLQVAGQVLQGYVIDAYQDHVSSAMAATQFLKSLTAFAFPLFAPRLYQTLGYNWGNSMLAFTALAIGVPAPLIIWVWGAKLRAKARSSY